jgi:hypothetical protein
MTVIMIRSADKCDLVMGGGMLRRAELLERAAMCQAASEQAANEAQRFTFQNLRDLWTNLADEAPGMSETRLAGEISAIERIHAAAFGLGEDKAAE